MISVKEYQKPIIWISLVLTIISTTIFCLTVPKPNKYKLALENEVNLITPDILVNNDLDFDGNSEKITFYKNHGGALSILAESNERILFQNKYDGQFMRGRFFFINDCNKNKRKEIFFFRVISDSLFLDVVETYPENCWVARRFITKLYKPNGTFDQSIGAYNFNDLNNDGFDEFIFCIACGYSLINRNIYIYNPITDSLLISPKSASSIFRRLRLFDIDSDNHKEIFGQFCAIGNSNEDYPWTDQHCWLMVYTDSLTFKFQPYITGNYTGDVETAPYCTFNKNYIAAFQLDRGKTDSTFLALFNSKGHLVRYKKINYCEKYRNALFLVYPKNRPNHILLYANNGEIQEFDSLLNPTKKRFTLKNLLPYNCNIDIDLDGTLESIFTNEAHNMLTIYREGLRNPASITATPSISHYFSVKQRVGEKPYLTESTADKYFEYSYNKNKYYKFRYLLLAGFAMLTFFAFYTIGLVYVNQLRRKYNTEKDIFNLQLKALENNQLNPHFTLNIINSIGSLYEKHDIQNAQYYFGKYTKLLRQSLLWSGQISNSLENEMDFVKSYLELEKLRLNGNFEFYIDDKNLPDIQVPKFLIHTFTENAVKHGITPIIGIRKGIIKIQIARNHANCKITISDNGIGMHNSQKTAKLSTGKGFIILNEILLLYKKINGKEITYHLNNIKNEEGTTVEIIIGI